MSDSNKPGAWDGAEEWMPLAWALCADECGEDACTELVWEGGPVPEPWGGRWLKYEGEAKRLIALVREHAPALATQPAALGGVPQGPDRLTPFDAVARAMDMASLLAGAVAMSNTDKADAYAARLREHLIRYIYPTEQLSAAPAHDAPSAQEKKR